MKRFLFYGGEVFDGSGAPPAPGDVAIENGHIVDCATGLDGDIGVDCRGCTLLPGLIDCHAHIMTDSLDFIDRLNTPYSYACFRAARALRRTVSVGITTLRDAGGADHGLKRAIDDGLVVGPRLVVALSIISQTGGHADGWWPSGATFTTWADVPKGPVDGVDALRRRVRELLRGGADVIKVATSGGVLSRSDPSARHFSDEELDVVVAEAAAANRPVMAHAQSAAGVKAALRAGARSIEHGVDLDDEAISMMLERQAWLVPTLLAPHGVLRAAERGVAIDDTTVEKCRSVIERHARSFALAVSAGVQVAMGSDCPASPHGTNLDELTLMSSEGDMSASAALCAATSSAAALLGLDDELGSVGPGRRADLTVVRGGVDDLADLSGRIVRVWKDGQEVTFFGVPADAASELGATTGAPAAPPP